MSEETLVRVVTFSDEEWSPDFPPDNLNKFSKWFEQQVNKVPLEYRDSARIYITSVSGYEDDHNAEVEIIYRRPETEEETTERLNNASRYKRNQEKMERLKLAELKAKYEGEE